MRSLSRNAYGNYEVLDPQGKSLFFCQKKKFDWYLTRNLAIKITDKLAQLNFQPKGMGNQFDPCLLQKLENKCVVCGSDQNLTRHHIVPYAFRKVMVRTIGRLNNFDVLPLCITCHSKYEYEANKLKEKLNKKYDAKLNHPKLDTKLLKIKKAVWALQKHCDKLPEERINKFYDQIKTYLSKDQITLNDLDIIANTVHNIEQGKTQAEQIIEKIYERDQSLDDFALLWRKHFLSVCNPKFLPINWIADLRDAKGTLK